METSFLYSSSVTTLHQHPGRLEWQLCRNYGSNPCYTSGCHCVVWSWCYLLGRTAPPPAGKAPGPSSCGEPASGCSWNRKRQQTAAEFPRPAPEWLPGSPGSYQTNTATRREECRPMRCVTLLKAKHRLYSRMDKASRSQEQCWPVIHY